jgi:DMSO/TMAO reductase YedYZ molybdopterin-dependent catalytic subunit
MAFGHASDGSVVDGLVIGRRAWHARTMTTPSTAGSTGRAHALEPSDGPLTPEELQLATRNRGMPLEALRYDITPTGLHYLLVHFDIPAVEARSWRLRIGGRVRAPIELSLDELRARPRREIRVTMECAGNGRARLAPRPLSQPWLVEAIGTAEWGGTPLGGLLEEAGLLDDALEAVFTGADRGVQGDVEHDYARSLPVADAMRPEVLLAYEMNGAPLEPQHGYPLRLLVPGWYGMTSVKWLTSIELVERPFEGFQQATAYRIQRDADDPGEPVTRIRVRALMSPPGLPDFFSRHRIVERGRVRLYGRAWSGDGPIARVEVGVDGHWTDATLLPPMGEFAWRGWVFDWDATPGEHELACRATDASGAVQPLEQPWNYQGMANNLVQRVAVTVG